MQIFTEPQHLRDRISALVVSVIPPSSVLQPSSIAALPSTPLTPLEVTTYTDDNPLVLPPNNTGNRPSVDGQQRKTSIGNRIFAVGAAAPSAEPLPPLPVLPHMPSGNLTTGSGYSCLLYVAIDFVLNMQFSQSEFDIICVAE
jgi:hypothetical protein